MILLCSGQALCDGNHDLAHVSRTNCLDGPLEARTLLLRVGQEVASDINDHMGVEGCLWHSVEEAGR